MRNIFAYPSVNSTNAVAKRLALATALVELTDG